jgi:hypothetical protein
MRCWTRVAAKLPISADYRPLFLSTGSIPVIAVVFCIGDFENSKEPMLLPPLERIFHEILLISRNFPMNPSLNACRAPHPLI